MTASEAVASGEAVVMATTSPDVKANELRWLGSGDLDRDATLVLPLGSTEQHGPHLPVSVDALIAEYLARELAAQRRDDVVLAPLMPYGSSGEHAGFAGTVSIGQGALEHVLVEFCRSATETFSGVFIVNGHGGNQQPLERACELMRLESRRVRAWSTSYVGDAHAGHAETSMMLRLHPQGVDMSRAEVGNTKPLRELISDMRRGGTRAVAPNGVLGDPTTASAEDGARLLRELNESLVADFDRWRAGRPQ
ncbi:creatinine amidohydrolase [Antricoccus suffuscus]|uniref:Creatinine amidohydrolase n=1 Tax=Antricoccus suffuscus TaxID=1629062 RepID=A0A2T1A074_9ACTN|nr:mycofactocin biosynthesis peptidyl-dipeptidase MftE [Antricoccus suffuscus]PRZ42003.1 creatinine amidohydrolase [Antricoccus suffuscus]